MTLAVLSRGARVEIFSVDVRAGRGNSSIFGKQYVFRKGYTERRRVLYDGSISSVSEDAEDDALSSRSRASSSRISEVVISA